LRHPRRLASNFLPPFPNGVGIMKVLTPAGLTRADGPLRLLRSAFPTFRPQPRNPSPSRFVSRLSARGCSRLRHGIAGSPRDTAESGSSTYGLSFHLQLLPTPPRDDAVTFDYWATTHPGADFHRASKASSRTHDARVRGNDTELSELSPHFERLTRLGLPAASLAKRCNFSLCMNDINFGSMDDRSRGDDNSRSLPLRGGGD
jgi:hypothetical protein